MLSLYSARFVLISARFPLLLTCCSLAQLQCRYQGQPGVPQAGVVPVGQPVVVMVPVQMGTQYRWASGHLDMCAGGPGLFLYACCCTPCAAGDVAQAAGRDYCMACFVAPCVGGTLGHVLRDEALSQIIEACFWIGDRRALVRRYGIDDSELNQPCQLPNALCVMSLALTGRVRSASRSLACSSWLLAPLSSANHANAFMCISSSLPRTPLAARVAPPPPSAQLHDVLLFAVLDGSGAASYQQRRQWTCARPCWPWQGADGAAAADGHDLMRAARPPRYAQRCAANRAIFSFFVSRQRSPLPLFRCCMFVVESAPAFTVLLPSHFGARFVGKLKGSRCHLAAGASAREVVVRAVDASLWLAKRASHMGN